MAEHEKVHVICENLCLEEGLTKRQIEDNFATKTTVQSLASGSPKGTYADAAALKAANPDTGVYIATGNGHIYSWTKNQSGNPVDLGVYQATGISENDPVIVDINNKFNKYVLVKTKNMFTGIFKPHSNLNNSSGVYSESSTNVNTVATEDYYEVEPNTKYILSCLDGLPSNVSGYFYNENKEFISYANAPDGLITTVANTKYLRVKCNQDNATLSMAAKKGWQLEKGNIATYFIEPYILRILDDFINTDKLADEAVTSEKIKDNAITNSKLGELLLKTKNIITFDKFKAYSRLVTASGAYQESEALLNTAASEKYVPIEPNENYVFSFKNSEISIEDNEIFFFYYNENKEFLNRSSGSSQTSPNNAAYARFELYKDGYTELLAESYDLQLEIGTEASEYISPLVVDKKFISINFDDIGKSSLTQLEKQIEEQIDLKRPAVIRRNRNQKFINFAFCTDTHLSEKDMSGFLDIQVVNQIASERWVDFVVHGGDIFNSYEEGTSGNGITFDTAVRRIDNALSGFNNVAAPIYIARGNHDVNQKYKPNYPDGDVDENQVITGSQYKTLCVSNHCQNVDGKYGCSFYKDYNEEKVRVIMLDVYVSDTQITYFTHDSLNWLANEALMLGDHNDYSVILFSHTLNANVMTPLITAFKNGTTFSNGSLNVTANYSNQGNGDFVGCICGHSHQENETAENGYWNIETSTSYRHVTDNLESSIYASVFTIDTIDHKLYKEPLGTNGHNYAFDWDNLTYEEVED